MPYYDHKEGLRYAFNDNGTSATLDEFIKLYERFKQTPEQMKKLQIEEQAEFASMRDGPPCLQILMGGKISEGGRNNGLFNIGVYLRKAFPDSWESEILNYNMQYEIKSIMFYKTRVVAVAHICITIFWVTAYI